MAYTTLHTRNKRDQLKTQLDDFATFQWRGHNMFDDYGCFIINNKEGSLKFYNGPNYTNQYAKPQFSTSVNGLLGVDFKQQVISMKVGLYWFTIEEYQEFLQLINPYEINYLTFDFAGGYGYLVKMGKISDSPRYVIGTDTDNQHRYYTELDLTWEVLGDNCVRANVPYEYNATQSSATLLSWSFNPQSDARDASLLDTSMLFEIPLQFDSATAKLQLKAKYNQDDINEEETLFDINLQNLTFNNEFLAGNYWFHPSEDLLSSDDIVETIDSKWRFDNYSIYNSDSSLPRVKCTTFHNVSNLEEGFEKKDNEVYYSVNRQTDKIVITYDKTIYDILLVGDGGPINASNYNKIGDLYYRWNPMDHSIDIVNQSGTEIDLATEFAVPQSAWIPTLNYDLSSEPHIKMGCALFSNNNSAIVRARPANQSKSDFTSQYVWVDNITATTSAKPLSAMMSSAPDSLSKLGNGLEIQLFEDVLSSSQWMKDYLYPTNVVDDFYANYHTIYQMFLRYDSESGLMYIQEGANTSWNLLNFQTDNNTGDYILQSATIKKWCLPGKFSQPNLDTTKWTFELAGENINFNKILNANFNVAPTIYARKNIV